MVLVVLVSDIYHTVDMIRDGVGDDFAKMVVVMGCVVVIVVGSVS